jgi:hypothetical protein
MSLRFCGEPKIVLQITTKSPLGQEAPTGRVCGGFSRNAAGKIEDRNRTIVKTMIQN